MQQAQISGRIHVRQYGLTHPLSQSRGLDSGFTITQAQALISMVPLQAEHPHAVKQQVVTSDCLEEFTPILPLLSCHKL